MSFLGDSWDNSQWLGEGDHVVKICEHRMFEYNTGTPGVEFILKGADERQVKCAFCLHEKATWKLANFCKDIGLTRAEADAFDVLQGQSYTKLIGKEICVTVVKMEKYDEVKETWPASDCERRAATPKAPPAAAPESHAEDDEELAL